MLEKLAKQTAIYGISTILGRMLSYLLTPFYTRIFGVESYGIITDVYALIPFALVVLTMGMESSYFRFATKAEVEGSDVEQNKRRLFATTWGITSLASLLFFAVVALFRHQLSGWMGEVYATNPLYIVTVGAIVMMDVVACIPFARLREQGKALSFVALKLFNILLQVGLAVVSIFCIVKKVEVLYSLKLLLAMLILFYLIGLVAKKIIGKVQEEARQQYIEKMREEERLAREERERQEKKNDESEEEESEEARQGKDQ